MDDRFVTISIRCPRCLAWSMDDANFCHQCGQNLRPWPESSLLARTKELLAESKEILGRLAENARERLRLDIETIIPACRLDLNVECSHCFRWRDHRKMEQTRSGRFLCFDNVDCANAHEEWLMRQMLIKKGCPVAEAEKWIETPLLVFGGLTPQQMIRDDREEEVKALLAEMESGFAF